MDSPSRQRSQLRRFLTIALLVLVCGGLVWHIWPSAAYGAVLGNRALQLANDEAGATDTYQLSFDLTTPGLLGTIQIQFCANDPFPATPCDAPAGFDDSAATLTAQNGPNGFSIDPASTPNELLLTRPPAAEPSGPASYDFDGIVNPTAPGAYYVRLQTFATADATGPASDYGGIAFDITNQLAISAEVPPYLLFCTAIVIGSLNCANAQGNYVDFGELSPAHTSSGSSQMLVATNAVDGYNVTVNGTTLTSGNNIIQALTANDVARPGVGQFGFNMRINSTPADGSDPVGPGNGQPLPDYAQPNSYRFDDGDSIVSVPVPDDVRVYTQTYIVNVPASQAPGIYVSTLTYICLANF